MVHWSRPELLVPDCRGPVVLVERRARPTAAARGDDDPPKAVVTVCSSSRRPAPPSPFEAGASPSCMRWIGRTASAPAASRRRSRQSTAGPKRCARATRPGSWFLDPLPFSSARPSNAFAFPPSPPRSPVPGRTSRRRSRPRARPCRRRGRRRIVLLSDGRQTAGDVDANRRARLAGGGGRCGDSRPTNRAARRSSRRRVKLRPTCERTSPSWCPWNSPGVPAAKASSR